MISAVMTMGHMEITIIIHLIITTHLITISALRLIIHPVSIIMIITLPTASALTSLPIPRISVNQERQ
jgi:hypothetical protein